MDLFSYLLGVASGGVVGTLWWIYYIWKRLPEAEERIETKIVGKIPKVIKESAPIIKEEIGLDVKTSFKALLSDIKADLESEEDNDTKKMIAELSVFASGIIMYSVMENFKEGDNKLKQWLRGELNKMAETMMKSLGTRAETAIKEYTGVNPGDMGGAGDFLKDWGPKLKAIADLKKAFEGGL